MQALKFTSCMSETADPLCAAIGEYLAKKMNMRVVFVNHIPWQERLRRLEQGLLHAGWICGLPYVQRFENPSPSGAGIKLLVAPVMAAARYAGRPVYFSDVVVRRDSPFRSFADLRARVWAYNDPGSFSGYLLPVFHLAQMGLTWNYFSALVKSGAHTASLRLVLEGRADAAAIDSTVFDQYLQHHPQKRDKLRVIHTLGPSPMPPWVVSQKVPSRLRALLFDVMVGMHQTPQGRAILARGLLSRLVPIRSQEYDPIRQVVRVLA